MPQCLVFLGGKCGDLVTVVGTAWILSEEDKEEDMINNFKISLSQNKWNFF